MLGELVRETKYGVIKNEGKNGEMATACGRVRDYMLILHPEFKMSARVAVYTTAARGFTV